MPSPNYYIIRVVHFNIKCTRKEHRQWSKANPKAKKISDGQENYSRNERGGTTLCEVKEQQMTIMKELMLASVGIRVRTGHISDSFFNICCLGQASVTNEQL